METNRMRKAIAILLAVLFVVTVTVTAVSAGKNHGITNSQSTPFMFKFDLTAKNAASNVAGAYTTPGYGQGPLISRQGGPGYGQGSLISRQGGPGYGQGA